MQLLKLDNVQRRCLFQFFSLLTVIVILFSVLYYPSVWNLIHEVSNSHDDGVVTILKPNSFRGWDDGVVTLLEPVVQRNCAKIFLEDKWEIKRVSAKWSNSLSDEDLFKETEKCSWIQDYFKDNLYVTKLERSFPIAFTFVVYESPQQVLRLLKLLYRPQNQYCIHPDVKSNQAFTGMFDNIAQCLDNVHIASKLEDVHWGQYTLMEAQMNCMRDLVELRRQSDDRKWKYVINLCGKELPLSTNHEIVSYLSKLNGTSAISPWKVPRKDKAFKRLQGKLIPFNLPYYKSSTYMGISYDFAHYLLTDPTAIAVHNFFKGCYIPEEHFYSTLYMIPGVPGGYDRSIPKETYFHINQYIWIKRRRRRRQQYSCGGKIVHEICIVTVKDLKNIMKTSHNGRSSTFHNKYFMEQDHVIMDCMEERLIARNKEEFISEN